MYKVFTVYSGYYKLVKVAKIRNTNVTGRVIITHNIGRFLTPSVDPLCLSEPHPNSMEAETWRRERTSMFCKFVILKTAIHTPYAKMTDEGFHMKLT